MREFIVIMRSGTRFGVKADRVFSDDTYVRFVVLFASPLVEPVVVGSPLGTEWPKRPQKAPGPQSEPIDPGVAETVAVFNRPEVVAVLSQEHLVSEVTPARGVDPIPF